MTGRLIAGSGRSGTTWVLDALAQANGLRPVFEPLHPQVSQVGREFAHRYLADDEQYPRLIQHLESSINSGKYLLWTKLRTHSQWLFPPITQFTCREGYSQTYRRWRKFVCDLPELVIAGMRKNALVKCIHANLMLGWLVRQCSFRIVLILRHPAAVIESEIRGNWDPTPVLERFKRDERLRTFSGDRYQHLLSRKLSRVEALAVRWVIENQTAIAMAGSYGIKVAHYERLVSAPESEWKEICTALGLAIIPSKRMIARPSQQSAAHKSHDKAPCIAQPRWLTSLTARELLEIQRVLDESGFHPYSVESSEPIVQPGRSLVDVAERTRS